MTGRRIWLSALAMGLLGSQAGHLLTYQLRFGAAAHQIQSSGAHAYFPMVARTSLGILAVSLIACLFMVGLARVLTGRVRAGATQRPSYIALVAVLFTLQLGCFTGQEVVEAAVARVPAGSPADLLLWGALGQLPVAALAAAALGWILTRFQGAIEEIRGVLAIRLPVPQPVAVAIPLWTASGGALLMSRVVGASLGKRGPPSSFSITSH